MRKILFYTDTPIVGGAEKHLQLLAKYLQQDGNEIIVGCSNFESLDRWCEQMKQDGIRVIRLKVSHKHDPRHFWQLQKIFRIEKPDILHLHLWNPGACRYAFFAAPQTLPIVATEHDPFPLEGIKKTLKLKTLQRTVHTIAVSHANAKELIHCYPSIKNAITVIHNGIDLNGFQKSVMEFTDEQKKIMREQLFQATENNFVITTVATLHPRKGLLYLLEAFSEIYTQIPATRLVIVGEGPQRPELERKIDGLALQTELKTQAKPGFQKAILLLGHQENIAQILKSSDLFVLPSIKEAFGLVLLEAMAAKLPIVASKVGGIPEIIENEKNGLLAEAANIQDLARKILQLINHPELRQKLALAGHEHVKEFDAKKMAKKTAEVYDNLL